MKVLFIAYYFDPSPVVGAQRVSYWARNLQVKYPDIRCDVITATDPAGNTCPAIDHVYHVPDTGRRALGWLAWCRAGIVERQIRNKSGLSWRRDLVRFLKGHGEKYDACVITGGPFLHMGIAPFIRKRFGCGVALDFRDPFADNPRTRMTGWKLAATRFLERRFIRGTDAVIVVNEYCRELLCDRSVPSFIIDNGYDEQVLDRIQKEPRQPGPVRLIYAGKLLAHRDPARFLEVLGEDGLREHFSFTHVGEPVPVVQAQAERSANIVSAGPLAYADALRCIARHDAAVLFTHGDPFESTTKIFDYLGLEKPILIVTDGEPRTGGLHDLTADYPAVFWCRNEAADIRRALAALRAADLSVRYPDKTRHARARGLDLLVSQVLRPLGATRRS